ncbi:MAG: hypothetical protein ACRCYW_02395, partial [Aeromonas sp.]|uniref:hypothetical protein n=1 Tax=Aeromonas sp. TaxID=647 RepID=UPI003F317C7F
MDTDTQDLRKQLAPPGTEDERAIPLMECLVDAVALPGKTNSSDEGEDLGSNIHTALAEIINTNNQLGGREDLARDLNWKNAHRHALKGVRNDAQLKELLADVVEIRDRTLRNLVSKQKILLGPEPWDPLLINAWSESGFVTVISRLSIDHY